MQSAVRSDFQAQAPRHVAELPIQFERSPRFVSLTGVSAAVRGIDNGGSTSSNTETCAASVGAYVEGGVGTPPDGDRHKTGNQGRPRATGPCSHLKPKSYLAAEAFWGDVVKSTVNRQAWDCISVTTRQ